jgi:hypothetical protein
MCIEFAGFPTADGNDMRRVFLSDLPVFQFQEIERGQRRIHMVVNRLMTNFRCGVEIVDIF